MFHSSDAVDRVQHFLQEFRKLFERASVILIERQPLGGLVHIEQLLYREYRSKTILCSPVKIHRHFHLPRGDYEGRKKKSIRVADPYVNHFPVWSPSSDIRKHDVADAVCITLWWLSTKKRINSQDEIEQDKFTEIDEFLEQFRFRGDSVK